MTNKIKVILAGIFSLLTVILIFIKIDTGKRVDRKAVIKNDIVIPANDSSGAGNDLYYLKHPYLKKGDQLNDERKYDSAIYYYREAAVKFEKEQQWENYVYINGYIGRLYLYVTGEDYEEALPYLEKAFEKGKQNLRGDHPYMATTYYYFGLYYYNKKLAGKSLEMHHKALEILLKNYGKDNIYTADVYDALGNVYANLMFDNSEAEKNYLKSIKIKETLAGEEKRSVLTSGYYNLVNLNFLIGDYEKAQTFCYEAIRNASYVKNHRSYWLELLEGVLASIYSKQQIFDKAIPRLKNAIQINYENNGDKSYLAYYHSSLGDIYSKTTNYKTAIFYYKKALALALKNNNSLFYDQQQQNATTYYSLGMTYLNLKNYRTARYYLTRCLDIRLKIYGRKHRETAIAFQGIGSVYREAGLPDSALKYFQSGLIACTKNYNDTTVYTFPLASAIDNSFHSYQVIRDKASVLKQLYYNHPSDARLLFTSLAYYCLADTIMTLFRSAYDREAAKLVFSKNNNSIYEEAIDCATLLYQKTSESRYLDLVFNFMDKRKSGLLLEALNQKELLKQAGIPAQEQDTLGSLQQELAFLQSQLEKENSKENSEETVLHMLHTRINITASKFNELQEKLSKNYPFYASIQHNTDTVHLKDVQVSSGRTNSLVLEYFWGDKAIYVLGTYKDSSQLLKINRGNVLDLYLDTLKAELAKGYVFATKEYDFISFQKSSYYLYNSLVKPMLASFNLQINKYAPDIIVIPDGPLSYIPIEALVTTAAMEKEVDYQKLNYLVNNYTISYDYSTRLLLKNYERQNPGPDPGVLALSFSKEHALNSRLGKLNILSKYDSAELPGSARELRAISRYMKGDFYMGDDATEYIFKKESPNYDILHLAVHGEADSLNSYNSRLIFKKGNDGLNDGNLYAYEIYNLPIRAKLAVLSACESGIGKLNPGEGIFSMARGFVYAGCPSVIMSYWRVNDNSTQSIISDFYKQISGGDKIHQSLRKAKLAYINGADRRTAHPANWAAFVAIGNMTPLVKESSPGKPVLLAIIIILIVISVYLISRSYIFKK